MIEVLFDDTETFTLKQLKSLVDQWILAYGEEAVVEIWAEQAISTSGVCVRYGEQQ